MRSFHPLLAEQATERMFGHADFIGRNGRPPEDPRPPWSPGERHHKSPPENWTGWGRPRNRGADCRQSSSPLGGGSARPRFGRVCALYPRLANLLDATTQRTVIGVSKVRRIRPVMTGPTDGGAIGGRYRRRLLRVLEDGRDAGTLEGRNLAEPQARDLVQHRLQVPGSMVVAGVLNRDLGVERYPREGVATAIVVRSGYLPRGYFEASEQVPPFPRIYVCTRVFSTTGGSHETQSPAGMSRGARP